MPVQQAYAGIERARGNVADWEKRAAADYVPHALRDALAKVPALASHASVSGFQSAQPDTCGRTWADVRQKAASDNASDVRVFDSVWVCPRACLCVCVSVCMTLCALVCVCVVIVGFTQSRQPPCMSHS